MNEVAKFSPAAVRDSIQTFTSRHHRVPTVKEMLGILGEAAPAKQSVQMSINQEKKKMTQLTLINGRLYTKDGDTVWVQQSPGSCVPARFSILKELGPVVTP